MSLATRWQIPAKAGVYVISEIRRNHGIPVYTEILYVGKTMNLKRRFGEHLDPYRSHNADLYGSIKTAKNLEFWFQVIAKEQLDFWERKLITDLGPKHNQIRYGAGNEYGKRNVA